MLGCCVLSTYVLTVVLSSNVLTVEFCPAIPAGVLHLASFCLAVFWLLWYAWHSFGCRVLSSYVLAALLCLIVFYLTIFWFLCSACFIRSAVFLLAGPVWLCSDYCIVFSHVLHVVICLCSEACGLSGFVLYGRVLCGFIMFGCVLSSCVLSICVLSSCVLTTALCLL
jgi:hypothetical protein